MRGFFNFDILYVAQSPSLTRRGSERARSILRDEHETRCKHRSPQANLFFILAIKQKVHYTIFKTWY